MWQIVADWKRVEDRGASSSSFWLWAAFEIVLDVPFGAVLQGVNFKGTLTVSDRTSSLILLE